MNVFFNFLLSIIIARAHAETGFIGVANKLDHSASIINIKTGSTINFAVGHLPHEIALAGGYAFVSDYGSQHIRSTDANDRPGHTLSAIQMSQPTNVFKIDLGPARCAPHGIAVAKNEERIYVTCEGRHEIVVIDVRSKKLLHSIPTNQAGTHLLAISSDESRAYTANFWLGTVSVIDLKARKLLTHIRVGRGCEGIALSPDDKTLFVTRVEENEIVKIDLGKLEITQRVNVGQGNSPIRIVVSPTAPHYVLTTNVGQGTLQIFNFDDLSLVRTVKVGRQPIGLVVSNDNRAFVANMKDDSISKINILTGAIEFEYKTKRAPDGIAIMP